MTGTTDALEAATVAAATGVGQADADAGQADALDFTLGSLQKTYDLVSQRAQYLDTRAAAFLTLLGLAGTGVAAFTAFVITNAGSAAGAAGDLARKPIVFVPFGFALGFYVLAAILIAVASQIKSIDAPTVLDLQGPLFDPAHPEHLPAKPALQAALITVTWTAIQQVNDRVNRPKHIFLAIALWLVVAAICAVGALSAGVLWAVAHR